jgi:hypothetical protein
MVNPFPGDIMDYIVPVIFFIALLAAFLFYWYSRSLIKNREGELKVHSELLRLLQIRIQVFSANSNIYSEADPEPYGRLARQVNSDLAFCSQKMKDLHKFYGKNKSLFQSITHSSFVDITKIPSRWQELNSGMGEFENTAARLTQTIDIIEKNLERLSNIVVDVGIKGKKVFELIGVTKQKLKDLDEFQIADKEFKRVFASLEKWEKTYVNQIPVAFISGDPGLTSPETDRVYIAKVFRLLNTIESEVKSIGSLVSEWRTNYDRTRSLRQEILAEQKITSDILDNLSRELTLKITWGSIERHWRELSNEIEEIIDTTSTVSELSDQLARMIRLQDQQTKVGDQIKKIQHDHQDLSERLRKRQPHHQMEWVKNAIRTMEEADEYNPENWSDIDVGQLKHHLHGLLEYQEEFDQELSSGSVEAIDLDRIYKRVLNNEADFARLSASYSKYFHQLKEIRRLDHDLRISLSQSYTALKQLIDLIPSVPFMKKVVKDDLLKFSQQIESLNLEVSDRSRGSIHQKIKRWNGVSAKILQSLTRFLQKLTDENELLIEKLRTQIDTVQDMLALNEPVFYNAVSVLKEEKNTTPKNFTPQNGSATIVELVHKFRKAGETWQRLIASTRALEEVSGPVIERLEKLEKAREALANIIKEAERIAPEALSWPPTTKRATLEKANYITLEEEFQKLRKNRTTAVLLVAKLSDLTDEYKELITATTKIVREAETEQKRFIDLEERLSKSKGMWQKVSRSYQDNLFLIENIRELIESINQDYEELKKRYLGGRISYSQAYQIFRLICRQIDQASVELDERRIIDIGGEIQSKL